eukprot:TRINITY_DN29139_c0_g5_i1.p1 TRINITY_DN29139_c0_g5~~TRINITY_DN29139_c0_g5_i1.p1  ORF type:complete len:120 (+),score=17.95 TRINITY_DN29139_c0_g5_i1:118-477(+)
MIPFFSLVSDEKAMVKSALLLAVTVSCVEAINTDIIVGSVFATALPLIIVLSIVTQNTWITYFIGLAVMSGIVLVGAGIIFATNSAEDAKMESERQERKRFESMPFHKQVLKRRRQNTQ